MKITELKTDTEVFKNIGPFAMDKDVHRALGAPLIHNDKKRWFVAQNGDEVIGFSCIEEKKESSSLRHSFVVEGHRKNGVYEKMLQRRIKESKNDNIETVCTSDSMGILEKLGFKTEKKLKGFTRMSYLRK